MRDNPALFSAACAGPAAAVSNSSSNDAFWGLCRHAVMLNVVASLLRRLKMQALGHPGLAG